MESVHEALIALQELDDEIDRAGARLLDFEPQLREAEAPLAALRAEVEATRAKLDGLRQQVTRLEENGEQKRRQLQQYEERLRMRNTREEAAARIELDLIKRAVKADEEEAADAREQATRTDLRLDDLLKQLEKREAELAPRLDEIAMMRAELEGEIAVLREKRQNEATRVQPQTLRLYERVRTGLSRRALAPLTDEGACGNCYNLLPVQEQSAVRGGGALHRCEACGVILYPG